MSKILLVEDEKLLSDSFSMVLRVKKFDFDVAFNGLEALELCKKQVYDVILLDIMMPLMNGIEFLKEFPKLKHKFSPRIIILSNLSIGKEIEEAMSLGAHKYIQKSQMEPKLLVSTLNSELGLA